MTDPTKRQQLEVALERAGAQMANVLFNLEQKPGEAITVELAEMMGNLRRDWDLAFGNLHQAVKLGAAPAARPVAVFEGYVDGQPLVKWLGLHPKVGAKLYLESRPAAAAPVVADGWQIVPLVPDDAMRTACKVLNDADEIDAEWGRMLSVAPAHPVAAPVEEGYTALAESSNDWRSDPEASPASGRESFAVALRAAMAVANPAAQSVRNAAPAPAFKDRRRFEERG